MSETPTTKEAKIIHARQLVELMQKKDRTKEDEQTMAELRKELNLLDIDWPGGTVDGPAELGRIIFEGRDQKRKNP